MTRNIAWEKFDVKSYIRDQETDIIDDDEDLEEGEQEVSLPLITQMKSTPMGLIPDVKTYALRTYELWIANTDFDITHREVMNIKSVPGVEILQILSRYRFIIGIGKLFRFAGVKQEINRVLCRETSLLIKTIMEDAAVVSEILPDDLARKVNKEFTALTKLHNYVAILVLPNGEEEVITSNDLSEFEGHVENMREVLFSVGGHLKITP